jgi:hypothetical protein
MHSSAQRIFGMGGNTAHLTIYENMQNKEKKKMKGCEDFSETCSSGVS